MLIDSILEVLITVQLPTLAEPKIVRSAIRRHGRLGGTSLALAAEW